MAGNPGIKLTNHSSRTDTATEDPVSSGGNFFFADYGVRVQNAKDTGISWEPQKAHGTSLMQKGGSFKSIGIGKRLNRDMSQQHWGLA